MTLEFSFEDFWNEYPRKVGRKIATRLWEKISMIERPRVIQVLRMWKQTAQWRDAGGQFIPYASTFLNQERWKDEPWTGAFEETNLQQSKIREEVRNGNLGRQKSNGI